MWAVFSRTAGIDLKQTEMKKFMTGSKEVATELTLKQWDKEQENIQAQSPLKPWKDRAPIVLGDLEVVWYGKRKLPGKSRTTGDD